LTGYDERGIIRYHPSKILYFAGPEFLVDSGFLFKEIIVE